MTGSTAFTHELRRLLFTIILLFSAHSVLNAQQSADADRLGMALEYFQSGKYHESLLIFQQLDKKYKLNPRFRAYIGLCYYYEWDYKKASSYFDKVLPELGGLAPHELSVYYYAAGESYFQMQNYKSALPYFIKDFEVCYNREKGDVCYRIGLCNMFQQQWEQAYDYYSKAEYYYKEYRDTTDLDARLAQIANMKNGCRKGISVITDHKRSILLHQSDSQLLMQDKNSASSSPWSSIPFYQTWLKLPQ